MSTPTTKMKKSWKNSFLKGKGKSNSPNRAQSSSTNLKKEESFDLPKSANTLPSHSARDLENAMEYIERYHTKFDGTSHRNILI